jgi:ribose 5-phosphate isomerase RpiB
LTGWEMVRECLEVWLTTDAEGGRHERRVHELNDYPAISVAPETRT